VRTHEKALANALQSHRNAKSSHGLSSSTSMSSPTLPYAPSSLASLSVPYLGFTSRQMKPAKLTLTPHHLYYLLSRFSELSIAVGPMDIRLESVNSDHSHANYVSFLNEYQRGKIRSTDRDSIHSVSSIRSVMSSMSSLWRTLGLSSAAKTQARIEKQQAMIKEDLKYLYSAFTKVPCLRLSPDHKAPLIAGYEEFPFDSAVPLFVFKNVTTLEITDLDFRSFCGWDRIADNVRSLTLKRVNLEDPTDLLINIVLDDMDRRRKRSAKGASSPVVPWPAPSPTHRLGDNAASPNSPPSLKNTMSLSPSGNPLGIQGYASRPRSTSPGRPSGSRHGSNHAQSRGQSRSGTPQLRRSSDSSVSSGREATPRGSSSNLLSSMGILPMSKWRFLRHLSLADNGLTTLTASSLSPLTNTLQSLDLSANHFAEIPDCLANLVALRALNLSNCMIDSVRSLARNPLPAITALNLRGNRLSSLAGIERLLSLERVDLRENEMTDPAEIARLTGIPNMTAVYVHRNPFTRTHSEYRITIFNLFRRTPGYLEDIFIDGTQPSSGEKKLLVDRAPEPPNVPVVKPEPEPEEQLELPFPERPEPVIEPFVDPFYERRKSQELLRQQRRKSDFGISASQRRKKATRRRVVELSESDFPAEPTRTSSEIVVPTHQQPKNSLTDDSTYGGSEAETTPVRKSRPNLDLQQLAAASPSPQLPPIETSVSPALLRTGTESIMLQQPQYNIDSEAYRQRMEALRNDFGNGWLSALSDEPWDNANQLAFSPSLQPVRTPSQGIVSGGRTLG
jgi:Leucine-rich repeat (LRR) protein